MHTMQIIALFIVWSVFCLFVLTDEVPYVGDDGEESGEGPPHELTGGLGECACHRL